MNFSTTQIQQLISPDDPGLFIGLYGSSTTLLFAVSVPHTLYDKRLEDVRYGDVIEFLAQDLLMNIPFDRCRPFQLGIRLHGITKFVKFQLKSEEAIDFVHHCIQLKIERFDDVCNAMILFNKETK